MGETELLQQILQGQAGMQESIKALSLIISEVREDSRIMRQTISDTNMAVTYAQAEIKHLREDHDRGQRDNTTAHDLIHDIIKEQVQAAWDERHRCAAERKEVRDKLAAEIMEKVSLKIERIKARTSIAILVYALSVIAFFLKETFFG